MRLVNKAYYFLIGFFCFSVNLMNSQNQMVADSLTVIYNVKELKGLEKLELLRNLSFNEVNNLNLSLKYAEELIAESIKEKNFIYLYRGYLQKGNTSRLAGNLNIALEAFFKCEEAAINGNYVSGEGIANMTIADIYSEMDNSSNAEIYYSKAIALLRKTVDSVSLATALLNAGDEALNIKKYDSALRFFEESGIIFENVDYLIGTAYNKGNIGMVYAEQGKNALAESNINESIAILEELEDYSPITEYLIYMSDIFLKKDDWQSALRYAQRSLNLSKKYGLKKQIGEANFKLSELHEFKGNDVNAYKYFKAHIIYRDSVINLKNVQEAADLRTNFEVSQEQIKVDLADERTKNQRNITIGTGIALLLIGFMAIGLYRRNKFIQKTKRIIEEERDRSDKLLLNILPEETAEELKKNGSVKAKKYDAISVLFTDFKGFTSFSEKLSPEALVETVDFYFSKFDVIIEKHGLEKIKTIGDAYMAAGGLHNKKEDHAIRMVNAAFEIAACVEEAKKDTAASDLTFDIRIGINTGPVVAGVVGTKKFAYDIWGDTVNVASRMESMSEAGKINISENTYDLVKNNYECDYRGEIEVKNRGKMKMYFVTDLKTELHQSNVKLL